MYKFSKLVHGETSSFFSRYYVTCMYRNLFIQSPTDGHADCFSPCAISKCCSEQSCFQSVMINLGLSKAGLAHQESSASAGPTSALPVLWGLTPWLTGSKISHVKPRHPRVKMDHLWSIRDAPSQAALWGGRRTRKSPTQSIKGINVRGSQAYSTKARLMTVISWLHN